MGEKMYAVFDDGGKQYRASEGDLVRVDLREAAPGDEVTFGKVLLLGGGGTRVGAPGVQGAAVVCTVEDPEEKGPKVRGMWRTNVNRAKRRWGHRQKYTVVRVTKIVTG